MLSAIWNISKSTLPKSVLQAAQTVNDRMCDFTLHHMDVRRIRRVLKNNHLDIYAADFYSPMPDLEELSLHRARWDKPSEMIGVKYDLEEFRQKILMLLDKYYDEYKSEISYDDLLAIGFGPGFPKTDGLISYMMMREIKPKRYIDVGAGLSTAHNWRATQMNASEGVPCAMTSIEPHPYDAMSTLEGVDLIVDKVQNLPLERFEILESGDVLFIDSTHIVRIDGDVPYLFLEVIPRLKPGVFVHIHDIHFPYYIPHPSQYYIFDWNDKRWPAFFTEAMLLQALLAFNDSFEILLSVPLLRHHDEPFLQEHVPGYQGVDAKDNRTHAASIWLRRTK